METNSTVKENKLAKRIVKGKERGQPCTGKYTGVEYTLRVKHAHKDCTVVYGDRRGIARCSDSSGRRCGTWAVV